MSRSPGVEVITLASPMGKITTSPGSSRAGGRSAPTISAKQEPLSSMWKLMTCSASGITEPEIADIGGDLPTKGGRKFMSK